MFSRKIYIAVLTLCRSVPIIVKSVDGSRIFGEQISRQKIQEIKKSLDLVGAKVVFFGQFKL